MATTAAAIRTRMITTVAALTPAAPTGDRFHAYREDAGGFRLFAEKNPGACFRRFSIRDKGDLVLPGVSNVTREWVETEFECVVAYPLRSERYGAKAALSLDDLVELDLGQLDNAIGTKGYQTLDLSTGGDAIVETLGTPREPMIACLFGVLRLKVSYWRSN